MSDEFDSLDLEILGEIPVGPGRKAMPLTAEFSRELTPLDLTIPATEISKPSPIKRLRDSHHAAARYFALGHANHEVAAITGYTEARLSILQGDPTFKELVEFYRANGNAKVAELRDRMLTVGLDALSVIQDRLDENPEEFKNTELRELARDMADRTGNGPQSSSVNVNLNGELSDAMALARQRVARKRAERDAAMRGEALDVTPSAEGAGGSTSAPISSSPITIEHTQGSDE